jgi:hypothetical protein
MTEPDYNEDWARGLSGRELATAALRIADENGAHNPPRGSLGQQRQSILIEISRRLHTGPAPISDPDELNAEECKAATDAHETFCWMVMSQSSPPGGREILVIPRADPDKYENMADLLFSSKADAIAWRDEELTAWDDADEAEQTYIRSWILCKRRITVVTSLAPTVATCKHCGRSITRENGAWVDTNATGDDAVWRETCDSHDTFTAKHEPMPDPTLTLNEVIDEATAMGLLDNDSGPEI